MSIFDKDAKFYRPQSLAVAAVAAGTLCAVSFYNYLIFHTLVEIFSVVVAGGIFIVAWNTRAYTSQDYLLFLGTAYLFVGLTDLFHTMAYKGMGVFPRATADEPTQLWILARFTEALALATAPSFARRKVRADLVFALFAAWTGFGLASIFYWKIFPSCFVEGQGLTSFKIAGEYVIVGLIVLAMVRLKGIQSLFSPRVYQLIFWALVSTIVAELSFTFYVNVYGLSNMVGHLFKLVSFVILYEAVLQTGFRDPIAVLFRDIKEGEARLREEKAKLAEKNVQLSRLSEMKDHFLAMAAHDLNHPVGVIMTYGEFLLDEAAHALSSEQVEFLKTIVDSSRSMRNILNDFLDIAAIEAGRLELHKVPTDMESLIHGIVALNRSFAAKKAMQIDFTVEGFIPRLLVDPERMEQVMNNLLSNAVKFSPRGSRVEVCLTQNANQVVLSVADQGMGIPKDRLDKLFRPFERLSKEAATKEKGSGLGLAIVKKIVEAHGGQVWVESEEGRGSTFFVAIPTLLTPSVEEPES